MFWGAKQLQGLHVGFFVALAALVVFWAILNRTTLGYEVKAVGYNPAAAEYGGISVRKNLIRAMAISGAFAGLAGGLDMLGYLYHYGVSDVPVSTVGFLGIATTLAAIQVMNSFYANHLMADGADTPRLWGTLASQSDLPATVSRAALTIPARKRQKAEVAELEPALEEAA